MATRRFVAIDGCSDTRSCNSTSIACINGDSFEALSFLPRRGSIVRFVPAHRWSVRGSTAAPLSQVLAAPTPGSGEVWRAAGLHALDECKHDRAGIKRRSAGQFILGIPIGPARLMCACAASCLACRHQLGCGLSEKKRQVGPEVGPTSAWANLRECVGQLAPFVPT
jgi:hypothetical protein